MPTNSPIYCPTIKHIPHYYASLENSLKMDQAFAFTTTSIEKCKTLVEFVRARQQIEADYASALRKLCKTASLQPRSKKFDISWFSRRRSSCANTTAQQQEEMNSMLMKSTLWSTYYEIVDDTSQLAKSHAALADSMQQALVMPMFGAIKEMEVVKRAVYDDACAIMKGLTIAEIENKKNTETAKELTNMAKDTKMVYEMLLRQPNPKPKEIEKAKLRMEQVNERRTIAEQVRRQSQQHFESLQTRFQTVDLPRILQTLGTTESRRSRDVSALLQSLAILSQTCAHETEKYCSEMRSKCETDIRLAEDELMFTKAYFVLAGHGIGSGSVTQDDRHVEYRSGVYQDGAKHGHDVPSYEQLAASLVQLDRGGH